MKNNAMIEKLNAEKAIAIEAAVKTITEMKVAELRKVAPGMGVKNAKLHKGAELKDMLIKIAAERIEAEYAAKIAEAEAEAEKEAQAGVEAEPTAEVEAAEDVSKAKKHGKKSGKSKKAVKSGEKKDKRYKATKVEANDVDTLVDQIVKASPAEVEQMDLWHVNRKVLIEAMKQLHCKLWYRTYDKPTMITKIAGALGRKAEGATKAGEEVEAE